MRLHALTPTGPFCPFRSSASVEMEPKMNQLNSMAPDFTSDLNKVQMEMQMGQMPDKDLLIKVSTGMKDAVESWETLCARLRLSEDFQTREYGKLTQAHLATYNTSIEKIASMMNWQADCMKAMADGSQPPMPPADMDLEQLMNQDKSSAPPNLNAMQAAEAITAAPFSPSSFETDTVREEYMKLVEDHAALIKFGGKYGTFDRLGKVAFLDQVDQIQERWDGFYFRFKLMGALNDDFKIQCDRFLKSMNMEEDDYRTMLKQSHQLMREEAERER